MFNNEGLLSLLISFLRIFSNMSMNDFFSFYRKGKNYYVRMETGYANYWSDYTICYQAICFFS